MSRILWQSQYCIKARVRWLLWPLRIKMRYFRRAFFFIQRWNTCSSQASPTSLLDHPDALVVKKTWCFCGSTLRNQASRSPPFASKITAGSIQLPSAHMHAIIVIQSLLPSCKAAVTFFCCQSCFEKTRFDLEVLPMRKPFLSMLYTFLASTSYCRIFAWRTLKYVR
jgi:hypothetical protein